LSGVGTGIPVTSIIPQALTLTVTKIIQAALRALHVISPTESVSAPQAESAREALNIMIAQWSTQGLAVPYMTRETFTLTAGTSSYTWGIGGSFNSERPLKLVDNVFITSSGIDYPVALMGEGEYNAYSDKTLSGTPTRLFFDTTFALATVYLYPTPDSADTLTVSSQKLFTNYTGLTTAISLSPEYYGAMKWNLAIELCSDYEKEPSQTVVVLAERSLDAIRTINAANRLEPIRQNLGLGQSGPTAPGSILGF
jgi:hypothetical protein